MKTELSKKQQVFYFTISAFLVSLSTTNELIDIILCFLPSLSGGWIVTIKILYTIGIAVVVSLVLIFDAKPKEEPDRVTEEEERKKELNKFYWMTRLNTYMKVYPLNILTLKIIPLGICWFIDKLFKPKSEELKKGYYVNKFHIPKYWPDYDNLIKNYCKPMMRIYVKSLDSSYDIRFGRDYQTIRIAWSNRGEIGFTKQKEERFCKIFENPEIKILKWVTWTTPFGLYWNLIRITKG